MHILQFVNQIQLRHPTRAPFPEKHVSCCKAKFTDAWRREGKVCIRRFRGFGSFNSDYVLQFQSGNTFVADVALSSGKFYMEIAVLETDSVVQFGFFTEGFFSREPVQGCFKGVGDDACSWAVDGTRQVKCFTGAKTDFGTKWINGDVVIFVGVVFSASL